ncbi:MAG: 3-isopropylmalate dehydratase large subunit [Hyphomonas sp.]|nr:3-isopropylmalate dehydratase large subunit [Hyphomonas sp.]
MSNGTLFGKLWNRHLILTNPEGLDLIHVDRSLLTDLSGTVGLEEMEEDGRKVANPALHAAMPDHVIPTGREDTPQQAKLRERFVRNLDRLSVQQGIRHFGRGSGRQGIVHVVGLEQGFTLPGATLVCGDSHTSTHGAVGALAWGIGSTEVKHVLATQTLWMKRPKTARVWLDGSLKRGVFSKDLILWLIGELGADFGREHAVEFAGPAIDALSIEARASLCNLGVEMGARFALIAPDEKTFAYHRGRPYVPDGELWESALEDWRTLHSDVTAIFDKEVRLDVSDVTPQITWGVSPEHVTGRGGAVPAEGAESGALDYMGLCAGQSLIGLPVDYVFIGSCANSRIEDLRIAADIVRGQQVAGGVTAWVVPGSEAVKQLAEAEGLADIFIAAGFEWREPGCSMCNAVNGDLVAPGKRAVSTSNRNFVGRQGPNARTHLASPATAALCALAGEIRIAEPEAAICPAG